MYIIGGLKDVKSYIKLSLCFVLICMIYIRIIPQNEQKTTEILVKQKETVLPSEIVINEEKQEETKEVVEKPKEYINYRLTSFGLMMAMTLLVVLVLGYVKKTLI